MELFPTDPKHVYPCIITPVYNTLISDYENGGEQRRSKWMFPKFNVKLNYYALSVEKSAILWNFYLARRGAFEAFLWFDFHIQKHTGLYIATADGSTTIFDLPGKSTSTQTYYINGTVVSSGITFLSGGGAGGADRIQFSATPTVGQILSVDFTGYLRIKCRFKQDQLSRENFTTILMKYGIELKGL